MRLGLSGAGSMASALARGIGEPVLAFDPDRSRAEALVAAVGGEVVGSNAELAERADVLVLCHKPPLLEQVAGEVGGRAGAVASILAATTTERIEAAYPGLPVYRFLPSIPAEVRRGVLCYAPGTRAAAGPERELLELFGRAGTVMPLDEPLIEPAMALMSSGPAFMALVAESFAAAGTAHGIDAREAARMVVETLAGTAAYLERQELDTGGLMRRVATPGGVTEKGLATLRAEGVPGACRRAVDVVVEAAR